MDPVLHAERTRSARRLRRLVGGIQLRLRSRRARTVAGGDPHRGRLHRHRPVRAPGEDASRAAAAYLSANQLKLPTDPPGPLVSMTRRITCVPPAIVMPDCEIVF